MISIVLTAQGNKFEVRAHEAAANSTYFPLARFDTEEPALAFRDALRTAIARGRHMVAFKEFKVS